MIRGSLSGSSAVTRTTILALGTVQFGLSYGIANQAGRVSREEAAAIVTHARSAGLDTLEYLLQRPESVEVAVLPVDWPQFSQQFPAGSPPLLAASTSRSPLRISGGMNSSSSAA